MGRRLTPARKPVVPQESRADAAWKAMTSVEADESDRWNDIEENLHRSHSNDPKRWKYFGK